MSIWRSIVSPEFTNRCGVFAGMTTMPPAFTSTVLSPTVIVAHPSRVNATSTYGCVCNGGPLAGFCVDDVGRYWRALFLAVEFVRHSLKRQLLEFDKAHWMILRAMIVDVCEKNLQLSRGAGSQIINGRGFFSRVGPGGGRSSVGSNLGSRASVGGLSAAV